MSYKQSTDTRFQSNPIGNWRCCYAKQTLPRFTNTRTTKRIWYRFCSKIRSMQSASKRVLKCVVKLVPNKNHRTHISYLAAVCRRHGIILVVHHETRESFIRQTIGCCILGHWFVPLSIPITTTFDFLFLFAPQSSSSYFLHKIISNKRRGLKNCSSVTQQLIPYNSTEINPLG